MLPLVWLIFPVVGLVLPGRVGPYFTELVMIGENLLLARGPNSSENFASLRLEMAFIF
jgi:hypothetical protein